MKAHPPRAHRRTFNDAAMGNTSSVQSKSLQLSREGAGMTRREFRLIDGSSKKFWTIELNNTSFIVHFGRIGTAGQAKEKTFGSETLAKREYDKLILEKTKNGYVEVAAALRGHGFDACAEGRGNGDGFDSPEGPRECAGRPGGNGQRLTVRLVI